MQGRDTRTESRPMLDLETRLNPTGNGHDRPAGSYALEGATIAEVRNLVENVKVADRIECYHAWVNRNQQSTRSFRYHAAVARTSSNVVEATGLETEYAWVHGS